MDTTGSIRIQLYEYLLMRTFLFHFYGLSKVQYCHEVKTRKRFRSLKAAKNWIMEANQGEQEHEPLEAGDGSN